MVQVRKIRKGKLVVQYYDAKTDDAGACWELLPFNSLDADVEETNVLHVVEWKKCHRCKNKH